MPEKWFTINEMDRLDTPALVVYPERVKQNIATAKIMVGDVSRLRPHVKTYKNKELTLLMLDAGISKFKCATIAEAEMLGICLAPDVLLAYQPVGPKLNRFIQLIISYPNTQFSCLVDNIAVATAISEAAIKLHFRVNVYLDLNIGQNRTGIAPGQEALKLYIDCNKLPGVKPIGLHAYDGHIHDADLKTRTVRSNEAFALVTRLQSALQVKGFAKPIIIAGGSPTFPIHARRKNIECSPGTFVYWDRGYQSAFTDQAFLTAALVVTRVVSLPDETTVCLDLGHKSIAAENELAKRVYFLDAPELVFKGQSEEHLMVDAGKDHPFKPGDIFYGLPYHICPTVALYERAVTVENHHITGEWLNIARDRKIAI